MVDMKVVHGPGAAQFCPFWYYDLSKQPLEKGPPVKNTTYAHVQFKQLTKGKFLYQLNLYIFFL